ncbi:hypothetical protein J4G08_15045 [Candidatus Poribacteria bacterium]|nr:hypothetical protein [Candidatus Poribacteria bacterium]
MLPFVLKTTEESVQRLHIPSSLNSTVDVDVQTELYISEAAISQSEGRTLNFQRQNLSVLRRAEEAAYKAFTTFLQQISEPQAFLPVELLSQYPYQRYVLILSVTRSYELHEVFQNTPDTIWMDQGNSIFEYGGYELSLSAKHHILDSSAFLVAPCKFTVFMRRVNDAETIRFYRSSFIDLTENAPPPLHLNAQEVIEAVQQHIASREPALPIGQLLMFPPLSETDIDETERLTSCPECNGEVKRIGESNYFCLQCDWDNLLPLIKTSLNVP